jgi:hypothetical protein
MDTPIIIKAKGFSDLLSQLAARVDMPGRCQDLINDENERRDRIVESVMEQTIKAGEK